MNGGKTSTIAKFYDFFCRYSNFYMSNIIAKQETERGQVVKVQAYWTPALSVCLFLGAL